MEIQDLYDVESKILNAYDELAAEPNTPVFISDLREHLDADGPEYDGIIDDFLIELYDRGTIRLEPDPYPRRLTEAQQNAAFVLGGTPVHYLRVR